jgi:predicted dehydrogenase
MPFAASSRREFLKTSAAVVAGSLALERTVHAAGSDVLRVGLIGCGSRGTGAAEQALSADPHVKLVAMGDAFEDRLQLSLSTLQKNPKIADKIDVPSERRFVGFDAYQKVIASVDVVLLTTQPHFRPIHIKAAVDAGKHVFAEKPIAVDAPGVRSVMETCEEAKRKGLSIVSGLCLRYDFGHRETVKRLHDGQAGDIVALEANDYRGSNWFKKRLPEWTDMQWQMRNWYNFTWQSGDFNVEQHVHILDICAWVMQNEYPVKCVGMGGRQVRTGPEHGNIYDHFAVVYEYANGVKLYSNCRHQQGCKNDISARVHGSKGRAQIAEGNKNLWIKTGSDRWVYDGRRENFYQTEHDELFASIRNGKPINNGEYMVKSTLLAMMGRMAAYTGQQITWDQAWNSKEDLSPPRYDWHVTLPDPPIAIPGQTKFA